MNSSNSFHAGVDFVRESGAAADEMYPQWLGRDRQAAGWNVIQVLELLNHFAIGKVKRDACRHNRYDIDAGVSPGMLPI